MTDSKNTNEHSYIKEYDQAIKDGDIIVGRRTKQMIRLLLRNFTDPEVKVDLSVSEKRIRFIETECKLYEAPYAGHPFKLELFQKAIIESIYAFYVWNEEAGRYVRKYQDVLVMMGRKNGKSPLVAAIILSEWFCGEMGTKILIGSNNYEQADIMFSACDAMREESKHLARVTRRNTTGLYFGNRKQKKKRGKFSRQNKGSIKRISSGGGNKEGRNIKVGAIDEVHEMADNQLVMPIRQALSTQFEPLYFEITTEGFIEGGYLDQRLEQARKVLDEEVDMPHFLVWWYAQDSEEEVWQDERSWQKSNPGLGTIKRYSVLRDMVDEARVIASTRRFVLAKDFNIKQNSAAAWLDIGTLTNTGTFDLEEFRDCMYIGGLDFAETTDLCAAKAMFVRDGKRYFTSMYFIPETKADALLDDKSQQNPEHKDYRKWQREGFVTICRGTEVDEQVVADWFIGLYQNYGMRPFKFGYDNWHSKGFKKCMADYFGEEILERVGMDFNTLSGPMRALETDLMYKKVIYNNNPIDRWCLMNMSVKTNNIMQIMPVKKYGQSKNRIDGGLAMIICYAAYSNNRIQFDELSR